MVYTTLFFDLDGTLYDSRNGLWEAIRDRMSRYMYEQLDLPKEEVPDLRRTYFERYGTTLRGLQIHYRVDADEYLAYVHDLPLKAYLKPIPALHDMLLSLPQRRWIFTNADDNHARRVLDIMGLADCFDGIVDVRAIDFACKPEPEAYLRALQIAGEEMPQRCVLLDDTPRNLLPARKMGFTTVLVGGNDTDSAAVYSVPDLLSLPEVMPELWKNRVID